jgi:4-amino-4-deoxy-L-arabinose transferase-like glycosyltransferase
MATNTDNRSGGFLHGLLSGPAIFPVLIILIGLLLLLTLHEGQNWSGDFAQYIHHARNLVEGRHYLDTNYLANSISYFIGPYSYPPVYPLLLTPVYWLFGLDFEAMKWVGVICFCLALYYMVKTFSYKLGHWQQLAIVLLVGLNPYMWNFSNLLRSDFTFTLFCYLSLYLMIKAFSELDKKPGETGVMLKYALLLGVSTWLAYGTRTIGLVLPMTLLTYDIIFRRRISFLTMIALSIFALMAFLQSNLLSGNFTPQHILDNLNSLTDSDNSPGNISYFSHIRLDFGDIKLRIIGYRWALQGFWTPDGNTLVHATFVILSNLTILAGFVGYVLALFRRITVLEIFLAGYVAALLIFSGPPSPRYLIPLFPLALYYMLYAYRELVMNRSRKLRLSILTAYLAATTLLYGVAVSGNKHEELDMGIEHPQAVEMFDYIREESDPDDTIVFRKPRIMALLTGRKSSGAPDRRKKIPDLFDRYLEAIEADYYVVINLGAWMLPVIDSTPPSERLHKVFRNDYFVVYKFD